MRDLVNQLVLVSDIPHTHISFTKSTALDISHLELYLLLKKLMDYNTNIGEEYLCRPEVDGDDGPILLPTWSPRDDHPGDTIASRNMEDLLTMGNKGLRVDWNICHGVASDHCPLQWGIRVGSRA